MKTKNTFRAKPLAKNGKTINQWKFGEIYSELDYGCGFRQFIRETDYENQEDLYCPQNDYFIDSKTICQYTGMNDKNGVEIYEGDILLDYEIELESQQDISGKLPVVYDSSKCQFSVDNSFKKDGSSLVNFIEYFGVENLEIVGNIFDNPENLVLKVKSLGKKICTYGINDFKCSYDKLLPVKITESALLRCGFSQTFITDPQMPNAQSKWCLGNFQIFKYEEEDFYFFSSFNSDITQLRFIHDLQNLYFANKRVELDFFK